MLQFPFNSIKLGGKVILSIYDPEKTSHSIVRSSESTGISISLSLMQFLKASSQLFTTWGCIDIFSSDFEQENAPFSINRSFEFFSNSTFFEFYRNSTFLRTNDFDKIWNCCCFYVSNRENENIKIFLFRWWFSNDKFFFVHWIMRIIWINFYHW